MTSQLVRTIIIGVDTHKDTHVAVALDSRGTTLGHRSITADMDGYLELKQWARTLGKIKAFGVKGTGSYGAGLSRLLLTCGHRVIEVTRSNRLIRARHGKNDHFDAEGTARTRSEAALACLCGACLIPASSGRTNRFRFNRGGNRQANAAHYRVAIVKMRTHPPTLAYVEKKPQTERPAVK
uniref:IS110 family transposase n=1 Tax=Neokomagataea thailandica TaxID=661190 RepID=UPI002265C1B1